MSATTTVSPATSTELRDMLRKAMTWANDRPVIDNTVLLVVADWCEEKGMMGEANAIRESHHWTEEEDFDFDEGEQTVPPAPTHGGYMYRSMHLDPLRNIQSRTLVGRFKLLLYGDGSASATVHLPDDSDGEPRDSVSGSYWLLPDEEGWPGDDGNETFPPGALQRIRDCARWHLICHMLGWPPMRLVGEG